MPGWLLLLCALGLYLAGWATRGALCRAAHGEPDLGDDAEALAERERCA